MYVCTYVFLAFRTQHWTEMTSQKFSNRLRDRPRPRPFLLVLLLSTAKRHRHTQWKFRSPSFAFALSSSSLLLLAATASSERATQKKICQFSLFLTTQQQWIAAFCSFCSNERTPKRGILRANGAATKQVCFVVWVCPLWIALGRFLSLPFVHRCLGMQL